ncbi:MAG: glycosyltransferase family 2 protein [Ignavibacteria bacterium]|nr:glycosyltransferase family 2 protein [Ignavibacteria bacterium]MBT8392196.1 glycosyltransferase family 2 protein [Ignavibacteria bacterium]NNL20078.1 glycosyltransferase family 2 protein [Ignavibacteriaceae bacterium]
MEKISIIIPCRNEEKFLRTCMDSVLGNDYPKDKLEIFVVDGKSEDNSASILEEYSKKYDFIRLEINENKTVPFALNLAIRKSSGSFIIRLDAHSEYPSNYFSELVTWCKKLDADNVGALWNTEVKNINHKTIAIKKVLRDKLGVGNSYFRTGIEKITEVDTVPFGCFQREVFEKVGLFNHLLTRNQDIELNKRIKRANGKIFLLSNLAATYYARETFWDIAKNNYATGYWNVLTVYITKYLYSISVRHFVPLIFLLSLILPILFMIWVPLIGFISLASLVAYIATITVRSFKLKDETTTFGFIFLAFLNLHFSYGFGSIVGLFRLDYLFKK